MLRKFLFLILFLNFSGIDSQMCNDTRYYINKVDDFDHIKDCDIINGNLFINGENKIDSIANLDKIKRITGHLVILDSHIINSLKGLQNIESIDGNDLYLDEYSVVIKHNVNNKNDSHQGLCYSNKIDWSLITDKKVLFQNNGKNCPECHPSCIGCFGAGPRLCQICKDYKYGDICVDECPFGNIGTDCIQKIPNKIDLIGDSISEHSILLNWSSYENKLINSFNIYINDNLEHVLISDDGYYYYTEIPTKYIITNYKTFKKTIYIIINLKL